jgi:hypothetical protein
MIRSIRLRKFVIRLVSFSIISLGFAQGSSAEMIGTQQLVDDNARISTIARVETLLLRQDVAEQLQTFGVDQAFVESRVNNMTQAELAELEGLLDQHIAGGGDVISLIGAVFLVLLILELVGVTDIFKAF